MKLTLVTNNIENATIKVTALHQKPDLSTMGCVSCLTIKTFISTRGVREYLKGTKHLNEPIKKHRFQ